MIGVDGGDPLLIDQPHHHPRLVGVIHRVVDRDHVRMDEAAGDWLKALPAGAQGRLTAWAFDAEEGKAYRLGGFHIARRR